MNLSVSYNQNLASGIDSSAVKGITQQIFQKAAVNNTIDVKSLDLSKFNRVSLGTDLYSGKVDTATARQIAMNNSMKVNLSDSALNSLKYLSREATKSVFKSVDGKVNITEVKETVKKQNIFGLPSFGQLTEAADLGSDKKGSNPFYRGELLNITKKEEVKTEEALSLLA